MGIAEYLLDYFIATREEKYIDSILNKDNDQNTSLHIAAKKGYLAFIKKMVTFFQSREEMKKDLLPILVINHINKEGYTALHYACQYNQFEIVEYFLEKGANLELNSNSNDSIIMITAKNGHAIILQKIFTVWPKAIELINEDDEEGNTSLYHACKKGHLDTVNTLLFYGADCHIANFKQETPLDVAINEGLLAYSEQKKTYGEIILSLNQFGAFIGKNLVSNNQIINSQKNIFGVDYDDLILFGTTIDDLSVDKFGYQDADLQYQFILNKMRMHFHAKLHENESKEKMQNKEMQVNMIIRQCQRLLSNQAAKNKLPLNTIAQMKKIIEQYYRLHSLKETLIQLLSNNHFFKKVKEKNKHFNIPNELAKRIPHLKIESPILIDSLAENLDHIDKRQIIIEMQRELNSLVSELQMKQRQYTYHDLSRWTRPAAFWLAIFFTVSLTAFLYAIISTLVYNYDVNNQNNDDKDPSRYDEDINSALYDMKVSYSIGSSSTTVGLLPFIIIFILHIKNNVLHKKLYQEVEPLIINYLDKLQKIKNFLTEKNRFYHPLNRLITEIRNEKNVSHIISKCDIDLKELLIEIIQEYNKNITLVNRSVLFHEVEKISNQKSEVIIDVEEELNQSKKKYSRIMQ